jgi:hypothetical protein
MTAYGRSKVNRIRTVAKAACVMIAFSGRTAWTRCMSRRRLASFALAIGLCVALTGCPDPTPPAGGTVGGLLNNLSTQVQQIIMTAGQTLNGTLLTAAGAVEQDIDAAAAAYGDLLTMTLNQVNTSVKSDLDQLSTLITQLTAQVQQTISEIADQAAALLVQIGFGGNTPIVKSYGPRFTTPSESANGFDLHLHGVFPRADQPGYAPTLKIGGVPQPTSALESNDLTDLTFRIPPGTFRPGVSGISPPEIEVDLPYAKGGFLGLFKKVVPGAFHIEIATLPDSPVKSIQVTTTTAGTQSTKQQPVTTSQVELNSLDCKSHSYQAVITPDQGWTIETGSITIFTLPGYPKGPPGSVQGPNISNVSPYSFTVTASTTPYCPLLVDEGGRIYFHLTYTEQQTTGSPPVTRTQALSLGWGGQNSASVPQSPGTWQATVVLWNGVQLTVPPATTNVWATIKDLGNTVAFTAPALSQVTLDEVSPTS